MSEIPEISVTPPADQVYSLTAKKFVTACVKGTYTALWWLHPNGGFSCGASLGVNASAWGPVAGRGSEMWARAASALGVAWVLLAGIAPAKAECVEVDVLITWSGGGETNATPWPSGHCVVPTPFAVLTDPEVGHQEHWVPEGLPNGAIVRAQLTSP